MRIKAALLFSLVLAATAFGADLPDLVLPEGVGVNIHFTRGHERDLDLIAAAGFKFVRMDFGWGGTERKPGEYQWTEYDELAANLEKRGLRAIFILDYANGLYEEAAVSKDPVTGREHRDTASPQHPASVAAFAQWAAAAVRRFQGRRVVWEIWNEPNIGFWKPKPDAKQYAELALATCRAVKSADPRATLIAPASSEFPWAFIEDLFKAGALEYLDGVSVHPYRSYHLGPETAVVEYRKLRQLIERYAPPGKKQMPIISGEWGYATHTKGVSLETQAAFIARQQLANLLRGIPLSIWYDWKNDGSDPAYNENNFGTVTQDLQPKPSYVAVQTLTRELAGCQIVRRLEVGAESDYLLLLTNRSGQQKLAAWTEGQPHALPLDVGVTSPEDVALVDGQGKAMAATLENGKLAAKLEAAPQFFSLKRASRSLQAAAAWRIEDGPSLLVEADKTGARTALSARSDGLGLSVEAGKTDGLRLPVRIRNPFPYTVKVLLELNGPEGVKQAAPPFVLRAGQERLHEFALTITKRSPEPMEATVAVTFIEGTDSQSTLIARWSERRQFVVTNPLSLSLAPVEQGWRLDIRNPSRSPFRGVARLGGQQQPVDLSPSQTEAVIRWNSLAAVAAPVQVLDDQGRVAMNLPGRSFSGLALERCRAALDGSAAVPAQASIVWTNLPGPDRPFTNGWRLDYQFEAGWRFVRCLPGTEQPAPSLGRSSALGLWVYGDRSGNLLRMRVTDERGQTFQPNGPALDWSGGAGSLLT